MKIVKARYSIASLITYIVAYMFSNLVTSSLILSVSGLVFCIVYIIIGLRLVENYAALTFKINS